MMSAQSYRFDLRTVPFRSTLEEFPEEFLLVDLTEKEDRY